MIWPESFCGRSWRFKKFPDIGSFGFGDLDADAAGGERIAVDAQGGEFVGDERVKPGGFKARADELGFRRVERLENGDGAHLVMKVVSVLEVKTLRSSVKTMMPAPVWSRL